ncbi:hypothetical protein [Sodalis sp. RH20]|uniref:hypothetical protein n=1 Tax=unclassified Sodalis (in: enterobacteria) TaxID=2636512 RepID=UPI0039B563F2
MQNTQDKHDFDFDGIHHNKRQPWHDKFALIVFFSRQHPCQWRLFQQRCHGSEPFIYYGGNVHSGFPVEVGIDSFPICLCLFSLLRH